MGLGKPQKYYPSMGLMKTSTSFNYDNPSVVKHLEMLQAIISRMADNSSQCKTWCLTLISAIIILTSKTGNTTSFAPMIMVVVLLFYLDAYYHYLERGFRSSYESFIDDLKSGQKIAERIFTLKPSNIHQSGSLPIKDFFWPSHPFQYGLFTPFYFFF